MTKENRQILFDKFEIIDCLKKDDYSGVYIAFHIYLGKKIFLKIIDQQKVPDPSVLKRFKREAKILAKLDHPNIIQVYDFGTLENNFYISFEYFESQNLRQIIKKKVLSFEQKTSVFARMIQAVNYAHHNHIIHRDLKPENILVNSNNEVKIADFGLAQISEETVNTAKSALVGTPCYMSPEQVQGEPLSVSSDLFSLGVVGYELFAGKNLFLGKDIGTTLNNILNFSETDIKAGLEKLEPPVSTILKNLLRANANDRINQLDLIAGQSVGTFSKHYKKPLKWGKRTVAAVSLVLLIIIFAFYESRKNQTIKSSPVTNHYADGETKKMPVIDKPDELVPFSETEKIPAENREKISAAVPAENRSGPGKLFVLCSPWADVYLDSFKVDTTPLGDTLIVDSGDHLLGLKNTAYPFYYQHINIGPGKTRLVSVSLDTVFGFFQCNIFPWGELFVDNEPVGVSPFAQPIPVTQGNHLLEIKNPKYGQHKDYISITKKETLEYKLNFEFLVGFKQELAKTKEN